MLRRKITSSLLEWKNAPERLPLLVEGARQVGKTTAVLDFAEKNYRTVYNLDFFRDPSLVSIFEGSLDPSAILTKLSVAGVQMEALCCFLMGYSIARRAGRH